MTLGTEQIIGTNSVKLDPENIVVIFVEMLYIVAFGGHKFVNNLLRMTSRLLVSITIDS